MQDILDRLGLAATNPGTWYGATSSTDESAGLIESVNPTTGDVIAGVYSTSQAEYDRMIDTARESFGAWRMLPAPVRGNAVRLIGEALRDNKDALGSLVTLEFSTPSGPWLGRLYRFYLHRLLPRVGDGLSRGSGGAYRYLADTIAGFPEPDVLAGRIRESGFAACGWDGLSGGIVAIHTALKAPG